MRDAEKNNLCQFITLCCHKFFCFILFVESQKQLSTFFSTKIWFKSKFICFHRSQGSLNVSLCALIEFWDTSIQSGLTQKICMLKYFLLLQIFFYKFEMIVCWRCGGRKIQLLNELFHGLSRFEQICFRLNARKHTNVFCLQWMIFTEFEAKYFEYFYEKLCSYKWVCGCIIIAARLNLSIKFATFLCKNIKIVFLANNF